MSTLVCRTYGWDPQNRTYRAATGPPKKSARHFFYVFWSKLKSRPALPNRANPLACTLGSVGVCHAQPPGPGRTRAGPGSDLLPLRHPYFEGPKFQKKQLPPRSHRVESLEERQVSTLVCRTHGWDPQNRTYRAATGPQKKCSTLRNFFKCFGRN